MKTSFLSDRLQGDHTILSVILYSMNIHGTFLPVIQYSMNIYIYIYSTFPHTIKLHIIKTVLFHTIQCELIANVFYSVLEYTFTFLSDVGGMHNKGIYSTTPDLRPILPRLEEDQLIQNLLLIQSTGLGEVRVPVLGAIWGARPHRGPRGGAVGGVWVTATQMSISIIDTMFL